MVAVQPPPLRTVVLSLASVYVIWGSTYLAMRIAVEGLPPFMMASARFLVCGLLLFTILKARGAEWPTRKQWLASVPVGALMFVLGNGTVAYAEKRISSGVAAVVCGTMPLWLAGLHRLVGEKTTPREWAAMVVGISGVVLLSMGGELQVDPFSAVVLVCAPISWALGSLLARRLPMAKGLMSAATQMLAGGAIMTVVSLIAGERVPVNPPIESVIAWAYLATFGSIIAYSAYTWLLANTRPAIATSYAYVNPAVAVFLGIAFGGEKPSPNVFGAVALIVVATVLVIWKPAAGRAAPVQPTVVAPE